MVSHTPKGGYPGAGRPKGSLSVRTRTLRKVQDEAIAAGITPIEVMLNVMRLNYEVADKLIAKIKKDIEAAKGNPKELRGLIVAFGKLQEAHDKALHAADLAAPYCHARVSPQQGKDDGTSIPSFTFNIFPDGNRHAVGNGKLIEHVGNGETEL
jgi:hypothetical protein